MVRRRPLTLESQLWRLRVDFRARAAQAWIPSVCEPFRRDDAVRSALRALLTLTLLWRRGAARHAAAVTREGRAVVALGASRAGKTTFAGAFPWERVLADDLAAVTIDGHGARVSGTPFRGKEGRWGCVQSAPIGLLALLEQGPATRLARVGFAETVGDIAARVQSPAGARALRERTLAAAIRLARRVPCVRLTVSLKEDPWPILHDALARCRRGA